MGAEALCQDYPHQNGSIISEQKPAQNAVAADDGCNGKKHRSCQDLQISEQYCALMFRDERGCVQIVAKDIEKGENWFSVRRGQESPGG